MKKCKSKNEKLFSLSFFTLDERIEKTVKQEIDKSFSIYSKMKDKKDMKDVIYSCVKELLVNASQSNIKKTFFVETKIDEKDQIKYLTAKRKVRKIMTEHCLPYLREKLKKYNYDVQIKIENKDNGIIIIVQNPNPLYRAEEERIIRQNLKKAMENDFFDLRMFYSDDAVNDEGAGLGLLFIVNLLKKMEINPAYFRIGIIQNNTVARIEIPINRKYIGIRETFQ